ncbi:MAG: hypothetical protein ONB05_03270 [candidate division KSB1 bacterium]|nr:hypothetical protein [candidate division KSB1 bacterium]
MSLNFDKKILSFLGGILIFMLLLGCEEPLPEAYQKETFTISALDAKAYRYLSLGLAVPIATVSLTSPIDSTSFDFLIANSKVDTLLPDTTLLVSYPAQKDTSYAFYYPANLQGRTTYFFITWDLTPQNMNAYIDMDIIQRNAKLVTKKSTAIPLETIATWTDTIRLATGQDKVLPKIRTRNVYELDKAPYLVRFIISEPSVVGPFRVVILHD